MLALTVTVFPAASFIPAAAMSLSETLSVAIALVRSATAATLNALLATRAPFSFATAMFMTTTSSFRTASDNLISAFTADAATSSVLTSSAKSGAALICPLRVATFALASDSGASFTR